MFFCGASIQHRHNRCSLYRDEIQTSAVGLARWHFDWQRHVVGLGIQARRAN
jgi:hypothetical protein